MDCVRFDNKWGWIWRGIYKWREVVWNDFFAPRFFLIYPTVEIWSSFIHFEQRVSSSPPQEKKRRNPNRLTDPPFSALFSISFCTYAGIGRFWEASSYRIPRSDGQNWTAFRQNLIFFFLSCIRFCEFWSSRRYVYVNFDLRLDDQTMVSINFLYYFWSWALRDYIVCAMWLQEGQDPEDSKQNTADMTAFVSHFIYILRIKRLEIM